MPIKINGTNTTAQPSITGTDTDTGLVYGTDEVSIVTGGTDRVKVDGSGNVGIGTTSPSNLLTVSTNTDGTTNLLKLHADADGSDNGLAGIKLSGNAGDHAAYIYGGHETSGNTFLSFYTDLWAGSHNATERMRIRSDGYVQFSNNTSDSQFYNSGTYHLIHQSTDSNAACIVEHSGNSSPSGVLIDFTDSSPDNNTSYFLYCQDSGTSRAIIWSDGDLDNHDNSYGGMSDEKLKQDIVDAGSQWDDLKDLRVRKFKFKSDVATHGDEAKTLIGLVAQEAETVSPGLVKDSPDLDEDGNDLGTVTKSVRYSVLYMKAIKALQEAMERIETLETQNASLEARLTALEGGAE